MYLKILCDSRETNLLTVCHRFLSLDQKKKGKEKKKEKKSNLTSLFESIRFLLKISLDIDDCSKHLEQRYIKKRKKRKKGTTFELDKMIDDTRNEIRKLEINNSSDLPRFCNVSSYEMGFFFSLFFPKLLNHSRLESC